MVAGEDVGGELVPARRRCRSRGPAARGGGRRSRAAPRRDGSGVGRSSTPAAVMWSRWAVIAVPQLGDAGAVRCRPSPTIGTDHPELAGAAVSADSSSICCRSRRVSVDARPVGLVDGEDVGDLHQAGLGRLHAVAPPGVDDDDGRVGLAGDLDLDLPDADGLDDDPAVPERVEQADRLRRRQRQPAEVAAGRHRADEHARVGGVVLHPHAVAEDGPAGERRRRVDGEHGDLVAEAAEVRDQRRCQRALAGARRPGEPDRVGVPGQRGGEAADLPGRVAAALDEREQPGLGAAVAVLRSGEQVRRQPAVAGSRHVGELGDVDDLGDAVDAVAHDPLDAGLQRLRRRRAADARARSARPSRRRSPRRRRAARCRRRRPAGPGGSPRSSSRPVHASEGALRFGVTRRHSSRARRYVARVVNAVATSGIPAAVLAHQGGWDEILLVAGPIAVVAGLLWLARRRVTRVPTAGRARSTRVARAGLARIPYSDGTTYSDAQTRRMSAPTAARRPTRSS